MVPDLKNSTPAPVAENGFASTQTPSRTEEPPRLSIRPVTPKDGDALHALLTASIPDVLADRKRWLARWQWQYWANPYRNDRPAGWVLTDGERILGHLGAVYIPLVMGDVRMTGVIGADYVVANEAATLGGFFAALELVQTLFTQCADCLVMATTANDKTAAVFGRFGCQPVNWTTEFWRAPTHLTQQIRSFHGGHSRIVRRAFNSPIGSLLLRVVVARYRATARVPAVPLPPGCWIETTVPQLARDLGSLWSQCLTSSPVDPVRVNHPSAASLSLDRSQTYLDWRYANHPEREKVRVLVLRNREGQALGAAIVFYEVRNDRNVLHVEDMIVQPQRRDVLRSLLCATLRFADHCGAAYLVTSPGHRSVRDVFWELSFEGRARNAPAAVINASRNDADGTACTLPDSIDDYLEFWHGMMF